MTTAADQNHSPCNLTSSSYAYTYDAVGNVTGESVTLAGLTPDVVLSRTYDFLTALVSPYDVKPGGAALRLGDHAGV
jgi:hypothetical protein